MAHRFPHSRPLRPQPLLGALLMALAATPSWAQPPSNPTQADAPRSLRIPAGALDRVLTAFAGAAGIELSVDARLLQGKASKGLAGQFSVPAGFAELLRGHGLQAVRQANGSFTLTPLAEPLVLEPGTALPVVRARGSAVREAASGPLLAYVAQLSATGSKTDTPLIETPQSISVVGALEMEDKGITTLTDAVAQTPGVSVNPYGFDARALDWVVLRGFDGWYTSSYRDGLIQTVGLTFLGVQTEIYGLERIDILRGPSSVLFGKGDVGGVVNRVSKQPSADALREVGVQVGSFGRRQLAADVGDTIDSEGRLRYRLVALALDTGTQEKYPNGVRMDQKRQYLAPSLRWQIAPQTSLVLLGEVLRDNASDDVQFVTAANGQPTSVKEGDPGYSRIRSGTDALGYRFEHQLDAGWTLRQSLRYARRSLDKRHILSSLADDGVTLERQARHDIESVKELTVDTTLQGTVSTGAVTHGLLAGIDWDDSRADWTRARDTAPSLDLNAPVYGIGIPDPVTAAADTRATSRQLGVYLQDQLRFGPHWRLTLGARHDRVRTDTDDRFNAARLVQTDTATTGRAGVSYLVGNGWAPYIGYAESFVPNVGVGANGQAFTPSQGKQVELGAKYLPEGAALSFAGAVFDLRKTGVVTYDPVTGDPRQIGRVRSRGLELEAKAALTRQLKLTASFTALDMKILASANTAELGRMPILTPRQTGALWLDYALPAELLSHVSVSAGLRHIGKRWNDEGNTVSEPAYTLLDAAIRYDNGPWRLALNATNLANKQYYSGKAYGSYYRGVDRNVLLTAKYRF